MSPYGSAVLQDMRVVHRMVQMHHNTRTCLTLKVYVPGSNPVPRRRRKQALNIEPNVKAMDNHNIVRSGKTLGDLI